MKKLSSILLFSLGLSFLATVSAQSLSSGYYRVQNHKTTRYVYVRDNTGSINTSNASAEMGALELWKNREYISDPSAVLYVNHIRSNIYNIESQGTGVYQIIGYNVHLNPNGSSYELYAEAHGVAKYLADDVGNPNKDEGHVGFNNTGEYRKWDCAPIDATTEVYFGINPEFQAKGKYYQPFFAAFPFNTYSTGMKVYAVTKVDKAAGIAVISEIQGDVPGGYPVIVETSSAESSDNRLNLLTGTVGNALPNALAGVYFNNEARNNRTPYNANTMRLLTVNAQGKLAFAKSSEAYLPANKAFLQVDADAPAELVVMTEEEYENALNVPVSGIALNVSSKTLTEGETFQLSATVTPDDATDTSLTWSSSRSSVATVDQNGLVTAVAPGKATITVKANDGSGKRATCTITVEKAIVLVSTIELNETEVSLVEEETFQLTATVTPEDATDATVSWSSSDETVATVSAEGLVTAVAEGTATITVKANDESGIEASCVVTVDAKAGITSVMVDVTTADVYTLSGIKVRVAGQSLAGLASGLYIVDGKKVIIY